VGILSVLSHTSGIALCWLSMMMVLSKSFPVIRKVCHKYFLLSRKHLKMSGIPFMAKATQQGQIDLYRSPILLLTQTMKHGFIQ
jgi:hypothetical protein